MLFLQSTILLICTRQQKKLLQFLEQLEQLHSPPLTPTTSHLHTTKFNSKLHSHSNLPTNKAALVAKKQSPSSAGTQRRTSFDWLNDSKIQRSQSVDRLSNVIGLEVEKKLPSSQRPCSGRTSGLRGLLQSGGHQIEVDNGLLAKR